MMFRRHSTNAYQKRPEKDFILEMKKKMKSPHNRYLKILIFKDCHVNFFIVVTKQTFGPIGKMYCQRMAYLRIYLKNKFA